MTLNKHLNVNQLIQYVTVVYAFILPLSRAGIGMMSALLILLWFLKPSFKEDVKVLVTNKFIVVLVIFVLYSFFASLWAHDIYEGLRYTVRYWYYLPILVIATSLKKEYIIRTFSAFLLGMLISEILSYGIFFQWWDWRNVPHLNPSPFMHHIQYSAFLVFTALFLFNKILCNVIKKEKIIYILFFITITANLFINAGRIGYLTFVAAMFILLYIHTKSKLKGLAVSIAIIMTALTFAYNFSPVFEKRLGDTIIELNKIQKGDLNTSFGERLSMYYMAGDIISKNPLFGVGTGSELQAMIQCIDKKYPDLAYLKHNNHFHNAFIQIFVQLGFVGFMLMILIFYYAYKIDLKDKYFSNIKIIFLTIFILVNTISNGFHQQFTMALFALVLGLLLAENRIENEV